MTMKTLHILNGDCALEGWRPAGLPGRALVWRENYLTGAIPRTDDPAEFRRVRAAELHKAAPEKSEAEILAELAAMEQALLELTSEDTVVLWFDVCPFDRTMLARILYLLAAGERRPALLLVFEDTVWTAEAFTRHHSSARRLTEADLRYGAMQWREYLAGAAPETLLARLRP